MKAILLHALLLGAIIGNCKEQEMGNVSHETPVENPMVMDNDEVTDTILQQISGNWYPILYTESIGSALTQKQIDEYLGLRVFISENLIVDFKDTIFDLKFSYENRNTADYLAENVSNPKELNILGPRITDVFVRCSKKDQVTGRNYKTTWSLAYDGQHALLFKDGVAFLAEKAKISENLIGTGNFSKEIFLDGNETRLELAYEFFSSGDEVQVLSEEGKLLYHSQGKHKSPGAYVSVDLKKSSRFSIHVNSKNSGHKWHINYSIR